MNRKALFVIIAGFTALSLVGFAYAQGCCGGGSSSGGHHGAQGTQGNDKAQEAQIVKGVQKATITIDGGYKPAQITVREGMPVELTFVRKDSGGCSETIVIKDLKFRKTIETGQRAVVKFTPKKIGDIQFECGMGMLKGKVIVTRA